MNGRYVHSERLVALFLFAVLLFNPPLLQIFDSQSTVFGFPVLYLYLFIVWAILIGLLALIIESSSDQSDQEDQTDQDTLVETETRGQRRAEGSEP